MLVELSVNGPPTVFLLSEEPYDFPLPICPVVVQCCWSCTCPFGLHGSTNFFKRVPQRGFEGAALKCVECDEQRRPLNNHRT